MEAKVGTESVKGVLMEWPAGGANVMLHNNKIVSEEAFNVSGVSDNNQVINGTLRQVYTLDPG